MYVKAACLLLENQRAVTVSEVICCISLKFTQKAKQSNPITGFDRP
jgi:hypothetical protein